MKILISGGGIAGLTLAYWLQHWGLQPSVIEQASQLRDDGFVIDFFGAGYKVAEQMHLLTDLASIHRPISRLAFVNGTGRERLAIPYATMRALLDGRHFSFMRGDLVQLLHASVKTRVPVQLGVAIATLEQNDSQVYVTLTDGTSDVFDLVVGADGVHSNVRQLAFGDENLFSRPLGYYISAFVAENIALRDDASYTLTVPRRRIGIYPVHKGSFAVFFLHRACRQLDIYREDAIKRELQIEYGTLEWLVPELLAQVQQVKHIYFDALTQIALPRWYRGRVVLLGDACQCVSPVAGQGASLAMASAYILARELATVPQLEIPGALVRYEQRMKPAIERKQQVGRSAARSFFAPDNHLFMAMQNLSLRMMTWPATASLIKRRFAWDNSFQI